MLLRAQALNREKIAIHQRTVADSNLLLDAVAIFCNASVMATQTQLDFSTPAHELHRGRPETSVRAAHAGNKTGDAEKIHGFIVAAGPRGLTAKEAAARMGKPLNAISGRLSNLSCKGLIKDSGLRRDASRVMVAAEVQLECAFCAVPISGQQAVEQRGLCYRCACATYGED